VLAVVARGDIYQSRSQDLSDKGKRIMAKDFFDEIKEHQDSFKNSTSLEALDRNIPTLDQYNLGENELRVFLTTALGRAPDHDLNATLLWKQEVEKVTMSSFLNELRTLVSPDLDLVGFDYSIVKVIDMARKLDARFQLGRKRRIK
jgi:hypothetical protein